MILRLLSRPQNSLDAHLRLLAQQLPVFFWTTDASLTITDHWGRGFLRRKGSQSSAIGRSITEYFRCADAVQSPLKQHQDALLGAGSRFEFQRRNRIFDMTVEPFLDPERRVVGCLGLALDITQEKKTEENMLYHATHDGLTGLFNYRVFFDSLEREVLRGQRTGGSFALLLIDLNDLKAINDRFGHLAGNRALKRIARVLKESCRASDLPARFGGDEFALLLIDANEVLARQVAARIDKILQLDPQFPPLRVSIGTAVYPQNAASAQALFEFADTLLYRNKRASRLRAAAASAPEFALGRLR
jgi:diguanylate cyclase (GGDEF)-like protein